MKRIHVLIIITILVAITFFDANMAGWVRGSCGVGALFGLALLHMNDCAYDNTGQGIFKDYKDSK